MESVDPKVGIDVSGVTFNAALLDELQEALTDTDRSFRFYVGPMDFSGATFIQDANFRNVTFVQKVDFSGATFTRDAFFYNVTFAKGAYFEKATFAQYTSFLGATFRQHASFDRANFNQLVDFRSATFSMSAHFRDMTAGQLSFFHDTTFAGDARFRNATFSERTKFAGATFAQVADFEGATFAKVAAFDTVSFARNADFSEVKILGRFNLRCPVDELILSGAELTGDLVAEVAAREVHAQSVRGPGSITLRVRGSHVNLERLAVSGPVTVQGLQTPLEHIDESHLVDPASGQISTVRIDSLREADAERLVLTDLNLTHCLFAGMHRLDQLRLDGQCTFAADPRRRRRVLAEEHHWRAAQPASRIGALICRTAHRADKWTSAPSGIDVVGPTRLQVLYRQLRVATETSKNEPGAADFYYGEMEMRRHSKALPRTERIIVTLYLMVSGYGLRASRAITTLAAAIIAATIIFVTIGFAHTSTTVYRPLHPPANAPGPAYQQSTIPGNKPGWGTAFYHAIDSSTSLLHTPGSEALTSSGRATEIALRLFGPVLLGLAVLAIRGRVKR